MNPQIGASLINAGAQLAGGAIQGAANKKEGKRAWRRTKVLNQNQIQWRVKDAQAAGIHPLAALGMSPIGNAMPSSGSVMGDAIANAGSAVAQGVSNYGSAKEQARLNTLAETESTARTALLVAQAREAQSQAEYTDQLRANSIIAQFKSPGRPNTNALQGFSGKHQEMYQDVDPRSTVGGRNAEYKTPWGPFEIDPNLTPVELIEQTRGEVAAEIFGMGALAHDTIRNTRSLPHQVAGKRIGEVMQFLPIEWIMKLVNWARKNPTVEFHEGPTPSGKHFNVRKKK